MSPTAPLPAPLGGPVIRGKDVRDVGCRERAGPPTQTVLYRSGTGTAPGSAIEYVRVHHESRLIL